MNERLFMMIKVSAAIAALLLSACGGPAKIVTEDESADYKSARSLPPLKKPSFNPAATQPQQQAPQSQQASNSQQEPNTPQATNPQQESAAQVADSPTVTPSPEVIEPTVTPAPEAVELPVVETPETPEAPVEPSIVEADDTPEAPVVAEPAVVYEPESEPASTVDNTQASNIRAEVITPNASVSRLQLGAPFDQSWSYMVANLLKSDITLHNRNKAAGRFAIGCGDIANAPEASRKGGWSFFDKKQVASEYCSLQLVSSKKNTIVSVINQNGAEVESAAASSIFNRLLNN